MLVAIMLLPTVDVRSARDYWALWRRANLANSVTTMKNASSL
jgi:hypothetical protein